MGVVPSPPGIPPAPPPLPARERGSGGEGIPEWLRQRTCITPDQIAVITGREHVTFRELDRRVIGVAAKIRALGAEPGDRVAVLCGNGLPFVELAHAVPRAGGILVPLNTRLTAREIEWQLQDVGASVLLHDGENEATARTAAPAGLRRVAVEDWPEADATEDATPEEEMVDLGRVHSIIYTSGTTGVPKGAMLTFGNFWFSAAASAFHLGHLPDDRWLAPLPLFHVGGLSILLRSVISGMTAVVQERFDAAEVNDTIDRERVSIVSAVSTMLRRMLDERGGRPYPPSLRCVLLGGGPAPRPLLERCWNLGVPVAPTYGLTETTSQAATLTPDEARRKPGSAGKPLITTEIGIDGEGEAGEIVVRGPTVTAGYFNRPEATERALRGGWLHTGDVGYLDTEGYLYVLDRREDLIVSGGENIYPAEVEEVLQAHPAVAEAGVFGVPDEEWGRAVAAALVPCVGEMPDDEAVLAFCRERLAGYKAPKSLFWIDALPRNAGGKLLRRELPNLLKQRQ